MGENVFKSTQICVKFLPLAFQRKNSDLIFWVLEAMVRGLTVKCIFYVKALLT